MNLLTGAYTPEMVAEFTRKGLIYNIPSGRWIDDGNLVDDAGYEIDAYVRFTGLDREGTEITASSPVPTAEMYRAGRIAWDLVNEDEGFYVDSGVFNLTGER